MGNRLLTACRTAPRLRTRPAVGRALTTVTAAGAVLAGLLGSTPQAQAATTVPSWLIPLHYSDDADGSHRACTGITLSKTRTLATPDCFTGRSHADMEWDHDLKSGLLRGGSSDPRYRSHPTYDAATRRGAVSVAIRATPASYGKPVMASPSDTALYATGAKATFYSWSGLDLDDAPRVRHTEQVVLKSAATCATLLGRTLPGGTLCTVPAPGAPPVADEDQCFGDAGGALVGGGKLIAISATRATGCVAGGVRLYTRISSYRSTITDWARDVDLDERISGSVLAREPSDLIDLCTTNQQGKLDGCHVDRMGSMLDWDDDFDFLTQLGDLGGDGKGDLLARTPGGTLYRIPNPLAYGEVGDAPKVKLGTGWSKYNKIVAARDLSGDGLPDILARDTSGVVWLHRGRSDGSLAGRTKVTTWKSYTAIAGRGDLSGDGRADIVTRDGAGVLWLYRGNGKGGFSPRTKIGSGWGKYNAIVGSGDMDHNGRQDILARTPAGAVYLYNANHTGGFSAPKKLADTRWKKYTRIS
ncbi:FG-GAP-like repeat-containing protein [Streptomyces sp. NBC_00846]|uniref:FG-GAP-like repeat-containing protein n=1 Tax=Streptomyces sp. NBC_00846 TaxID=2975849 RepID=UPI00386F1D97|nr:FG-GAP-like repeat-containing protein [Streptomyces sp. NBC_00846]